LEDRVHRGRWAFVRHGTGNSSKWLWQRFGPDGRLEKTSDRFGSYGQALRDALNCGFRPDADDYSADLLHGRIHYPPGRDPEFVESSNGADRRAPSKPQQPADDPKTG